MADQHDTAAEEPETKAAHSTTPPSEPPPPYDNGGVEVAIVGNGTKEAPPTQNGEVLENGKAPVRKGSKEENGDSDKEEKKKDNVKPVGIIRLVSPATFVGSEQQTDKLSIHRGQDLCTSKAPLQFHLGEVTELSLRNPLKCTRRFCRILMDLLFWKNGAIT